MIKSLMEDMASEAMKIGADQFDILCGSEISKGLNVYKKQVQNVEISNSRGIGIRLFRDGHPGYAHTEKFTPESINETVLNAWQNSFLTSAVEMKLPGATSLPTDKLEKWSSSLEEVMLEDLRPIALKMEELAEQEADVVNIPYLGMSLSSSESAILNSSGLFYSRKSNILSGGLGVVAKKGEISKLGYFHRSLKKICQFDAEFIAAEACRRARELLEPRPITSGSFPVILSNRISGQLFSMFQAVFFAERVQKNQSRLEGKLGKKIASSCITLIDDPHRVDLSGSCYFDSEGVLTSVRTLIKEGSLESYLYNLESSSMEGISSSGHGVRGYSSKAGTSFHNYIILPGENKLEDMISSIHNGLYVLKLEGGSGCSTTSGDISIGVQGLWIENGKISHAVEGVTLSTNFFDLLENVQSLSDSYNDNYSSVKVSDVLVSKVSLAG
jgi:PmbA protein